MAETKLEKVIRSKRGKLKKLRQDQTRIQNTIEQDQAKLNSAVGRAAGSKKKPASVATLRRKLTERKFELEATESAIKEGEAELEDLLKRQDAEALSEKVERWLGDSEQAIMQIERAESLRVDLSNLLNDLSQQREHVLRRLIVMVEQEGKEALENAGVNFESVIAKWNTSTVCLFDEDLNSKISAISINRLNLLNELGAILSGTNAFHKIDKPPVLKQPEPPSTPNMSYEEKRKFREAAKAKIAPVRMKTMIVSNHPERNL
jgi:chromosome segregation ATPase